MSAESPFEASKKILRESRREALKHVGKGALHLVEVSLYGAGSMAIAIKATELDTTGLVSGIGVSAGLSYISICGIEDAFGQRNKALAVFEEGAQQAADVFAEKLEEQVDNQEDL